MPSPTLRAATITLALAVCTVLLAGLVSVPAQGSPAMGTSLASAAAPKKKDPRKRLGPFVDNRMPGANQGRAYNKIGKRAQALWFGNEYYPTHRVKGVAKEYLNRAKRAKKTPMMVVYSIPDRDCGQHSAGGLPGGKQYKQWINKLASGIRGHKPMLILEPDALPFIGDPRCNNAGSRLALLRYATKKLSKAGAWVYIDAGHSGWTPYTGRAKLLKKAGVGRARGISTNVSNFRKTAAEHKYAKRLIKQLRKLKVKGVKYVVDTSRNGAKRPVNGDVYNPTWARLGAPPKLRFRGAFDGTLWVKHPGESDGPVNGGPSSGQWCDLLADRLLGRSGSGGC